MSQLEYGKVIPMADIVTRTAEGSPIQPRTYSIPLPAESVSDWRLLLRKAHNLRTLDRNEEPTAEDNMLGDLSEQFSEAVASNKSGLSFDLTEDQVNLMLKTSQQAHDTIPGWGQHIDSQKAGIRQKRGELKKLFKRAKSAVEPSFSSRILARFRPQPSR